MQNESLTAAQVRDLSALAGTIIPASPAYDVPGADDDKIFKDILRSVERDHDDVCRALTRRARLFPKGTSSSKATGRCSIRFARGRACIGWLTERNSRRPGWRRATAKCYVSRLQGSRCRPAPQPR